MLQRYSQSAGITGSSNCSMAPNPLGEWVKYFEIDYPSHDPEILEIEKAVLQDSLLRIQGALHEIADSPLIAMDLMHPVTQGLQIIAGEVAKLQYILEPKRAGVL